MTPGALCSLGWARCPGEGELCSGASAASLTCSCSRCSRCPLAPLASQLLRSHQLLHPASLPPLALQDLQQSRFLLQEPTPWLGALRCCRGTQGSQGSAGLQLQGWQEKGTGTRPLPGVGKAFVCNY